MYQLHRVFCATPWELERERARFHDLLGAFNETSSMQKGILFVPVTLANIRDKRPLQYAVDENIESCRYYLQLLTEDWGPAERNFRNDYYLALQSVDNPARPMKGVAVLAKKQASGVPLAEGLPSPEGFFASMDEFDAKVNEVLTRWLADTEQ